MKKIAKSLIAPLREIQSKRSIKKQPKIFCISFQRTGTTSVGQFFREQGFKVANYHISRRNDWTPTWFKGDYEHIFNSEDFIYNQVFEDDPWWYTDFYKYLFHKFPDAKFILMERNSDKWFDSMVSHSNGKTIGITAIHAFIYNREKEFSAFKNQNNIYSREIDNLLPLTENNRAHYKEIYENRNEQIKDFFNTFGQNRIIYSQLEDPLKWVKIGAFFNLNIANDYDVHVNKSVN